MADAPKILGTDSLRKAYPKLNNAIDNSNEALTKASSADSKADQAVSTANTAETKADSVQTQFNQVVIEGDSSVEAAQARVDADGNSFTTLKDRLDDRDAQLAKTEKESMNNLRPTVKDKKAIITFVSDDGMVQELTRLAPIFIDKGVPYTLAIPPNLAGNLAIDYPSDLKNLQDQHGFEIVSHTFNHKNLTTLATEAEIEAELVNSQNWLKDNGYKGWDILVYPQGGNNELVRKVARKYYKTAIGTLPNNGINEYPIKQFDVARVGLGSYFNTNESGAIYQDSRFPSDGSTLEYYKARVDYAVANGQWLIFMLHPWHADHTETQQQHIRDLIDYIKSKNVPITTVADALDIVGNTVDVGDYHYNTAGKEFFVTGANGTTKSSQIDHQIMKIDNFTFDSTVASFPKGISITPISTSAVNSATAKPVNLPGVLITNRSKVSDDLTYQEYHATNGRTYKRISSLSGTWGTWINPTRYKSTSTTVNATVPANSTYNHVVSGSGIAHEDVVSVHPASNIEAGIMYSCFVTSAGDVVIRLSNITSGSITMAAKSWRINAISVL